MADRGSSALDDDFAAFAQARTRVRCSACKIDPEVRTWAEAKIKAGASMQSVIEFLQAQGHAVATASAFKNHMLNHVT